MRARAFAAGLGAAAGMIVGLASAAGLAAASTATHWIMGPPFGVEYSISGFLMSQTGSLASEIAAFIIMGALAGALVPRRISPLAGPLALFAAGPALMTGPLAGAGMLIRLAILAALAGTGWFFYRRVGRAAPAGWLEGLVWTALASFGLFGSGAFIALARAGQTAVAGIGLACWIALCLALALVIRRISARLTRELPRARLAAALLPAATLIILLFAALRPSQPPRPPADFDPANPNIILIVLDTVRADHVSALGYQRPTTPTLERLARDGVNFTNLLAPAPWTLPSHASFFTGLYPSAHGCHHERLYLDRQFATVAEVLRARGYITLGYSNNPIVGRMSNLDQGFEVFVEGWRDQRPPLRGAAVLSWLGRTITRTPADRDAGAARTVRTVSSWFGGLAEDRAPFFLFINFMEAHPPLVMHPGAFAFFDSEAEGRARLGTLPSDHGARGAGMARPAPEKIADLIALYDGNIRYLDERISELLTALDRTGLADHTLVIVTSDHGEFMGERDNMWGHERTLYQQLLQVPMIVRFPERLPAGALVTGPASLRALPDFMLAAQQGWTGDELLAAMRGPDPDQVPGQVPGLIAEVMVPVSLIRVCEGLFPGEDFSRFDRRQKALVQYPWKLIWDSRGEHELYNLAGDPAEQTNLYSREPDRRERMLSTIESFRELHPATVPSAPLPALDPETIRKLRALGYMP